MDKKIWIFIGIVIVLLIGFFGAKQLGWLDNISNSQNITISNAQVDLFNAEKTITKDNIPTDFGKDLTGPVADSANVLDNYSGNVDSKVTVIEYADFQCPGCASQNPKTEKIRNEFGDKISWVYRYYPLISIHPNAIASATTAEAVARQNPAKFWEIHNALFDNQSTWENATASNRKNIFRALVQQVDGIDIDRWSTDYDNYMNNGIKTKIDFNKQLGDNIKIQGTPALVINGRLTTNSEWSSEDDLRKLITDELAK